MPSSNTMSNSTRHNDARAASARPQASPSPPIRSGRTSVASRTDEREQTGHTTPRMSANTVTKLHPHRSSSPTAPSERDRMLTIDPAASNTIPTYHQPYRHRPSSSMQHQHQTGTQKQTALYMPSRPRNFVGRVWQRLHRRRHQRYFSDQLSNDLTGGSAAGAAAAAQQQLMAPASFEADRRRRRSTAAYVVAKSAAEAAGVTTDEGGDAGKISSSFSTVQHSGFKWTFLFDPSGRFCYYWSAVVSLAVLYNLWVIIYRATMAEVTRATAVKWLPMDYTADFIYVLDVIFHFRVGYLEEGVLQTDNKKLYNYYINTTQFYVDCLCLLPLDLLYLSFGFRSVVRVFRIVKIYRFWAFLERTERHTNYPNVWRTVMLLHHVLAVFHWNACIFYFVSRHWHFDERKWHIPSDHVTTNNAPAAPSFYGSKQSEVNSDVEITAYLHALYWSVHFLTNIGDTPTPNEQGEYIFVIVELVVGLFLFATVLGHVANIVANISAARKEFQAKLDAVKTYMTLRRVPDYMQDKVIKWFDYLWMSKKSSQEEEDVMGCLPDKLKAEIAIHVHLDTLKRVEIFQNTEAGFLCELVLRLRPVLFSPGDYICRKGEVGKEMYIVARGRLQVVADNGRTVLATLKAGSYFGEISILNMGSVGNRRTASVRSVGYSDLFRLNKQDLWDVLQDYPAARTRLEAIAQKRLEKYQNKPDEQLPIIARAARMKRSFSTPGIVESSQMSTFNREHAFPNSHQAAAASYGLMPKSSQLELSGQQDANGQFFLHPSASFQAGFFAAAQDQQRHVVFHPMMFVGNETGGAAAVNSANPLPPFPVANQQDSDLHQRRAFSRGGSFKLPLQQQKEAALLTPMYQPSSIPLLAINSVPQSPSFFGAVPPRRPLALSTSQTPSYYLSPMSPMPSSSSFSPSLNQQFSSFVRTPVIDHPQQQLLSLPFSAMNTASTPVHSMSAVDSHQQQSEVEIKLLRERLAQLESATVSRSPSMLNVAASPSLSTSTSATITKPVSSTQTTYAQQLPAWTNSNAAAELAMATAMRDSNGPKSPSIVSSSTGTVLSGVDGQSKQLPFLSSAAHSRLSAIAAANSAGNHAYLRGTGGIALSSSAESTPVSVSDLEHHPKHQQQPISERFYSNPQSDDVAVSTPSLPTPSATRRPSPTSGKTAINIQQVGQGTSTNNKPVPSVATEKSHRVTIVQLQDLKPPNRESMI